MFPAQVTQLGTAADLLGEDACGRTNKDAAPGRLVGQPGIAGLLLAASQSCIWVFLGIIPLLSAFFQYCNGVCAETHLWLVNQLSSRSSTATILL